MDPRREGTAEDRRVAQIRLDIELARMRIAETVDALAYKADVPARIADVLSTTASTIAARVLQRIPSSPRSSSDATKDAVVATPLTEPLPDGG